MHRGSGEDRKVIFEEVMAENCSNWMKMINPYIQEAEQTPSPRNR